MKTTCVLLLLFSPEQSWTVRAFSLTGENRTPPDLDYPPTVYEWGFLRWPPLDIRTASGGNQSSFQWQVVGEREHAFPLPKHQSSHVFDNTAAFVLAQQQRGPWSSFSFASQTPPPHSLCIAAGLYKEMGHSWACFLNSISWGHWDSRLKHITSHLCSQLNALHESHPVKKQWTFSMVQGEKRNSTTWDWFHVPLVHLPQQCFGVPI